MSGNERWCRPPSVSSPLPRSFSGTSNKQRGLLYSLASEPLTPVACGPQSLPLNFRSPKNSSLKLGVQAGRGLLSTFCSGVAWASPSPLPTKRTLIWPFPREGHEVVFMSVPMKDEGSPFQPIVTMFFQGQTLPKCRDSQILTQGEADQRVPQERKLPVAGEPFTIVCNLFSKIYFVTI